MIKVKINGFEYFWDEIKGLLFTSDLLSYTTENQLTKNEKLQIWNYVKFGNY